MAGGDPKLAEQQSILAEYVYVSFGLTHGNKAYDAAPSKHMAHGSIMLES